MQPGLGCSACGGAATITGSGVGRWEERRGREKSVVMGRREHIINGLRKGIPGIPLSFSNKNIISKY
jgi:hypothetical protein